MQELHGDGTLTEFSILGGFGEKEVAACGHASEEDGEVAAEAGDSFLVVANETVFCAVSNENVIFEGGEFQG